MNSRWEAMDAPFAAPRWAVWEHASEPARDWALALLTVLVYLPSLGGAFVGDDWFYVVGEPLVRRWDGLADIWLAPAEMAERHYWPLVYTSFWLEHKLWGFFPPGYHAVNLALHALNVLLLWRLLRCLQVPGAWLVAAVFAVHPVHVESVAWIIERKDLLSGAFYLLAIHVWLRFKATPTLARMLLCIALYAMALLSKSIAVTLPGALLLIHWWQTGRIAWRDLAPLAVLAALGVGFVAADVWLYRSRGTLTFDYSAVERLLIAARALWVYAGQLAWPVYLPPIYPRWEVHPSDVVGWSAVAGLLVLVAGLCVDRGRVRRGPLAALAYFALTLSPVLGFVDFDVMAVAFVADRYQYLASVGLTTLVVGGGAWWSERLGAAGAVGLAVLAVLGLAVLSTLTWRQTKAYRDDYTLASHMAEMNPDSHAVQAVLATRLIAAGHGNEALAAARRARHLAQRSRGASPADATYVLGRVLLQLGRAAEAEALFREALAAGPPKRMVPGIRRGIASALVRQARYAEGISVYQELVHKDPTHDHAHAELGEALQTLGDFAGAADAFRRALDVVRYPGNEPVWQRMLGETLQISGRFEEASAYLDQALALRPRNVPTLIARAVLEAERSAGGPGDVGAERQSEDHPGWQWLSRAQTVAEEARDREPENALAHVSLGTVLLRAGLYDAARLSLLEALSLLPNRALTRRAHRLLGEVHTALGRSSMAAGHYRRALENYPLDHRALQGLANIHREAGRFAAALPHWRTLATVRPRLAEPHWRLGETLHSLGRNAEALQALAQALDRDPELDAARRLRDELRRATASGSPPASAAARTAP